MYYDIRQASVSTIEQRSENCSNDLSICKSARSTSWLSVTTRPALEHEHDMQGYSYRRRMWVCSSVLHQYTYRIGLRSLGRAAAADDSRVENSVRRWFGSSRTNQRSTQTSSLPCCLPLPLSADIETASAPCFCPS